MKRPMNEKTHDKQSDNEHKHDKQLPTETYKTETERKQEELKNSTIGGF